MKELREKHTAIETDLKKGLTQQDATWACSKNLGTVAAMRKAVDAGIAFELGDF